MNNPLGVSPSKGKQGTTRGKEKIFWPRWESNPYFLFAAIHHLKSSPTFSVLPCSSVGRVTVDLIPRSWVRFPPRSKDVFFASCGSCFPSLGLTPSGLFMGLSSTIIYTSELILCSTICVPSATRHNIHLKNTDSYLLLMSLSRNSGLLWDRASINGKTTNSFWDTEDLVHFYPQYFHCNTSKLQLHREDTTPHPAYYTLSCIKMSRFIAGSHQASQD